MPRRLTISEPQVDQKIIYDVLMHARYPIRTYHCHPADNTLSRSPPLTNDETTSRTHLRNLVARWNKCVYGNDQLNVANPLSEELCQDWQYLSENVRNPRIRLWGAATAYVLQKRLNLNQQRPAELIDDGNQIFKARFERLPNPNPSSERPYLPFVDIFTATTGTTSPAFGVVNRRQDGQRMRAERGISAAYYAKVTMTNEFKRDANDNPTKDYDIPDFNVSDHNQVLVSVTLTRINRQR